ncbi:DHH family phosphoesterase [Paenibacillus silviterrae]|uniref:DHH family phosphoesterase n=1 Tax=Paenibacillus silviterrae TaxID=3242194 RepID=UPI0025429B8F|nr:bifunctional oligoribonuclease/PAP phosphatase NrnA [Paenibacillus chinjuensis]
MTVLSYTERLSQAASFLRENDDFLVVSHIQPDGDAAGSTFAMAWMLLALGKRFTLINEGHMPEKFMYMTHSQLRILNLETEPPERKFGRVISVDCADFDRIGKVSACFEENVQLLNIDHHATNDDFGAVNLVRADAAATVEVLYDLNVELGLPFSHELNVCIYSGLLTDTGGFRYSNTSPKVMQIAADMLSRGVKGYELAERLLESLTMPQVTILKSALATLGFAHEQQAAWLSVSLEDLARSGASSDDLDGLVNYPRNIEGVEVGMLFKEKKPGVIKVSLRSAGKVDVAELASRFGGGGHVRAAGCTVLGTLDEAIKQVVEEVGRALA